MFKFPNATLESNPVKVGFSMSVVVTLTLGEKAMPISFVALGIVGKKWEPTFLGENSEKYSGTLGKVLLENLVPGSQIPFFQLCGTWVLVKKLCLHVSCDTGERAVRRMASVKQV